MRITKQEYERAVEEKRIISRELQALWSKHVGPAAKAYEAEVKHLGLGYRLEVFERLIEAYEHAHPTNRDY